MQKLLPFIIILILAGIGVGAYFLSQDSSDDNTVSNNSQSSEVNNTTPTANPDSELAAFTIEEVAKHASASDCWTVIEGVVYDITSYLPRHPGGDNILSACGVDGTAFFNGEKPGQNGGSNNHGNSAKSQLNSLKIGELKN